MQNVSSLSKTNLIGISPKICCIIAKCSRLSCVWKRVIPRYNSKRMQPIDQTSQGWDQPSSERDFVRLQIKTKAIQQAYLV